MNCKPGDLAMVVRNVFGSECDAAHVGRTIIRLRALVIDSRDGPCWMYEGDLKVCPLNPKCKMLAFHDANLMPLQPPGDEDEALTELPKEWFKVSPQ